MVTSFHAGYSGSHLPSVSSIESLPCRFELKDHRDGERLRRAPHLVKRVLVDRPRVGLAACSAGEGFDRGAGVAEADIGGDAGDLFERGLRREPVIERGLHSLDLGWFGSQSSGRKRRHANSGQDRNEPVPHCHTTQLKQLRSGLRRKFNRP